jgi:hypothetical protein
MALRNLIDHVGEDRFVEACAWAWRTAAATGEAKEEGRRSPISDEAHDVPHELEELVWVRGEASARERVALAFALYREMPCYATLMYTTGYFATWDDDARRLFWSEYRTLVSDADDRLAEPVAYSLWSDYFEDATTVTEAWREMAQPDRLSDRGLARVLDAAGPVPFALKSPLYDRLAQSKRWHLAIFRSLLHSAFDAYGDIDRAAAARLLARLSVPASSRGFEALEKQLRG